MSEEVHQSGGPSSCSASSLRFHKINGFTVHKQKVDDADPASTQCHMKVQMDSHGAVRLTTHLFATPSKAPKNTSREKGAADRHECLSYQEIPECKDNLPPEVDLGILDMRRRPAVESVSSNLELL